MQVFSVIDFLLHSNDFFRHFVGKFRKRVVPQMSAKIMETISKFISQAFSKKRVSTVFE